MAADGGIGTLSEASLAWSTLQTEPVAADLIFLGAGWPPVLRSFADHLVIDDRDLIVEQAVEDARRGSLRISVAVADEAGALLAFARMDGASRLSARTAADKTQTVILTGRATLDLGREWREDLSVEPELFYGMIARPGVVPFRGGVPVRIDGRLVGAVAVSGATSVQDHEIAARAAAVAGG